MYITQTRNRPETVRNFRTILGEQLRARARARAQSYAQSHA